MPDPAAADPDAWSDLQPLLEQELSLLPDRYRAVIVLCDLERKTRKEAARQLGVPEGTVAGQLARARAMLAKRLSRHGLSLSGGALAALLSQNASAAGVPAQVLSTTIKAATLFAAGDAAAAGAISAPVAALLEGVLKTMSTTNGKLALAFVLALGLFGAGWGLYATRAAAPAPDATKPADREPVKETKINLPTGPAPTQVLASIDGKGKLVLKTATAVFKGGVGNIFVPGNGGAAQAQVTWELSPQTFDLDDVEVLDTQAKKLAKKDILKML